MQGALCHQRVLVTPPAPLSRGCAVCAQEPHLGSPPPPRNALRDARSDLPMEERFPSQGKLPSRVPAFRGQRTERSGQAERPCPGLREGLGRAAGQSARPCACARVCGVGGRDTQVSPTHTQGRLSASALRGVGAWHCSLSPPLRVYCHRSAFALVCSPALSSTRGFLVLWSLRTPSPAAFLLPSTLPAPPLPFHSPLPARAVGPPLGTASTIGLFLLGLPRAGPSPRSGRCRRGGGSNAALCCRSPSQTGAVRQRLGVPCGFSVPELLFRVCPDFARQWPPLPAWPRVRKGPGWLPSG